jgi:hypothetical protein
MDYAQIVPELFLRSHPRSADDIDRLRQEAAITAVLNLQTDDDMRSANVGVGNPSGPLRGLPR